MSEAPVAEKAGPPGHDGARPAHRHEQGSGHGRSHAGAPEPRWALPTNSPQDDDARYADSKPLRKRVGTMCPARQSHTYCPGVPESLDLCIDRESLLRPEPLCSASIASPSGRRRLSVRAVREYGYPSVPRRLCRYVAKLQQGVSSNDASGQGNSAGGLAQDRPTWLRCMP